MILTKNAAASKIWRSHPAKFRTACTRGLISASVFSLRNLTAEYVRLMPDYSNLSVGLPVVSFRRERPARAVVALHNVGGSGRSHAPHFFRF